VLTSDSYRKALFDKKTPKPSVLKKVVLLPITEEKSDCEAQNKQVETTGDQVKSQKRMRKL